ncbi:transcriptional regulator [Paramagnetospirillum kuznetsovii]|uniref:Transcriptional regulator n=1 Tax=Paramagnetospirillum kuznetsovii TaxID=2053833 RepID=A0A364P163_9PROT|nr:transcriptional regulator [Paramagnetospirillum kuznetsovii]RAU23088.1 transcriptional regulator [Paramagnetospirillum kuznetsovii]
MAAKTVMLVLDDELAQRFERFAREHGHDEAGALDHALRAFLDAEDKARNATEVMLAAAQEGEATSGFGLASHHDDIRRWLLSWGSEAERKRPRSC